MKRLTPDEAETKRLKAAEFLHRVGKHDDAERFEAMDAKEYAEHKGAELHENPQRRCKKMAHNKSKQDLADDLDDANDYIEQLEAKLDDIIGIAGDESDDSSEDDDSGSDYQD